MISVFYWNVRKLQIAVLMLAGIMALNVRAGDTQAATDEWTQIVRETPYWVSKGVYQNILTIREWVLKERGFCDKPDRHILFDLRGEFLSYIEDASTQEATQTRLNSTRASIAKRGDVERWSPGDSDSIGYPFALSCRQPHVDLPQSIDRYFGTRASDRLWGAWDDLDFASQAKPESLHSALLYVLDKRMEQGRLALPETLPQYLAGQILIESGGRANAHSRANAKGILQLSPSALSDCRIKPANYWHRLAQIDCALRLMQQNARNIQPAFEERFGHLPKAKRQSLFTLLLVQAYHGGAGRVVSLLNDPELSKPAIYFAREHDAYSAGDILFGLIFHNLGRDRFGLASLYYVADVELATKAVCQSGVQGIDSFCN